MGSKPSKSSPPPLPPPAVEIPSQPPAESQPGIIYREFGGKRIKVRILQDLPIPNGAVNNDVPTVRSTFDTASSDETTVSSYPSTDFLPIGSRDAFPDDEEFSDDEALVNKREVRFGSKKTLAERDQIRKEKIQDALQTTPTGSIGPVSSRLFHAQLIMRAHPSATIPGFSKQRLWESTLTSFTGDYSWLIPGNVQEIPLEMLIPEGTYSIANANRISRHQKNLSLALNSSDFHKLLGILNRPIKLRNLCNEIDTQSAATPADTFVYAMLKMQLDDKSSHAQSSTQSTSIICLTVTFTETTQAAYQNRLPLQWGGRGGILFFEQDSSPNHHPDTSAEQTFDLTQ